MALWRHRAASPVSLPPGRENGAQVIALEWPM